MQCSRCRLLSAHSAEMAWIWGSCIRSLFLPCHTGVQRVVLGCILASENHPWTEASAILLEECKYLRICAKLLSCTPLEKERSSHPGIACCVSLKMEQNAQRTSSEVGKSGICSRRAKHHVVGCTRGGAAAQLLEPFENWKYRLCSS